MNPELQFIESGDVMPPFGHTGLPMTGFFVPGDRVTGRIGLSTRL